MKNVSLFSGIKKYFLAGLLTFAFVFGYVEQSEARPFIGSETSESPCSSIGTRYVKRTIFIFWIGFDNGSGYEKC